jgi:glycosyltransferase involved in cell wall biosynthesis
MPVAMRRTSGGSGDALSMISVTHNVEEVKDERSVYNRYKGYTAVLILLALIFAVYTLSLENSDLADLLEDCILDGENYIEDLHESEKIIDALEVSVVTSEDRNQKHGLSVDYRNDHSGGATWRPYCLSDVLHIPISQTDDQVMSAFQEKWHVADNPLYPQCGLVSSRPQFRVQSPTSCQIAVLTSWSPRACGIATYSAKLIEGLDERCPGGSNIDVIAVRNPQEPADFYSKEPRVKFSMQRDTLVDYDIAAAFINSNSYDIVILSYEFGIFGDEFIMCLLKQIRKARIITVLHTVAENLPWQKQALTQQVILLSHKVVVMTETMKRELDWLHSVPHNLIQVIPHGVPTGANPAQLQSLTEGLKRTEEIKSFWGFDSDKVIFSNGLLHQGKGIEHVLAAMPAILQAHPETKYIIQGAPHPTGEGTFEYYEMLRRTVRELHLDDSVLFFAEFLPEPLLLGRLRHSKIFINAYVDRVASVSGTLIMAMGLGLSCISTPYPFAREVLADQSGILIPFSDPDSISRAAIYLLGNPEQAAAMGKRAQAKTHTWGAVASLFLELGLNHDHM